MQVDRIVDDDSGHCCLVAIGRLQVTSTPNISDLSGSNSNSGDYMQILCSLRINIPNSFLVLVTKISLRCGVEFISRHSRDGKFTFVDQRVLQLLGYTPSELLGKSCFEFFHREDEPHMRESFEEGQLTSLQHHFVRSLLKIVLIHLNLVLSVLKMKGQVVSVLYRFRAKNGEYICLRTSAFAFLNPYTEDIEYIVCTNIVTTK